MQKITTKTLQAKKSEQKVMSNEQQAKTKTENS